MGIYAPTRFGSNPFCSFMRFNPLPLRRGSSKPPKLRAWAHPPVRRKTPGGCSQSADRDQLADSRVAFSIAAGDRCGSCGRIATDKMQLATEHARRNLGVAPWNGPCTFMVEPGPAQMPSCDGERDGLPCAARTRQAHGRPAVAVTSVGPPARSPGSRSAHHSPRGGVTRTAPFPAIALTSARGGWAARGRWTLP